MKKIKQFSEIFLAFFFLTSCRKSINDVNPIINSEGNINDNNNNLEKVKIEIKFSCGDEGIKKYFRKLFYSFHFFILRWLVLFEF